jgi:hypothetical protein
MLVQVDEQYRLFPPLAVNTLPQHTQDFSKTTVDFDA